MRTWKAATAARWGLIGTLLACVAASAGAATPWQRDWDATAPLGLADSIDWSKLRLQDSGDLFVLARSNRGRSLYRLRADASVEWQFSLSTADDAWLQDMAVLSSKATALVYLRERSHVALLSAGGELLWDVALSASRIAVSGDTLFTAGCDAGLVVVSALNAGDGSLRWQRPIGASAANCRRDDGLTTLVAGDDGGVLAIYRQAGTPGSHGMVRLDENGNPVWSVQGRFLERAELRQRGDRFYVSDVQWLHAFDAGNGQYLWQRACAFNTVHFVGTDPACRVDAAHLERLNASDGATVWQRDLAQGAIQGSDGSDLYYIEGNSWQRWSGSSGQTLWQMPFPATGFNAGLALNAAAGKAVSVAVDANNQPLSLDTYALSDGSLLRSDNLPAMNLSVAGRLQQLDQNDLFAAGQTAPTEARLRRLAADSGNLVWDTTHDAAILADLAITPNTVAVAEHGSSGLEIRSLDRGSGGERWIRTLPRRDVFKPVQLYGTAQDDVMGLSEAVVGDSWWQQLWRFSGSNGGDLWWTPLIAQDSAPGHVDFTAVRASTDLIINHYSMNCPARRIDALTGATRWIDSSSVCAWFSATVPAGDFTYFLGLENAYAPLSRRDAQTGAVQWTLPLALAGGSLHPTDLAAVADGDPLVAANSRIDTGNPADYVPGRAQLLRVKAQGDGLRYRWQGRPPLPGSTDTVGPVRVDATSQTAWLRHAHTLGPLGLTVLERFDLDTNQRLGAQFFGVSGAPPLFATTVWDDGFDLYQGQILASGMAARAPLIETRRHALRDFQIALRGDLALSIAPLADDAAVGSIQALQLQVHYRGDTATTATLFVDPPWPQHGAAPLCGGSGISGCSVDTRFSPWLVRFTAAPGARLQLDAEVRTLASPTPAQARIHAVVFGPEQLLESDGSNNIASSALTDVLFANGFD